MKSHPVEWVEVEGAPINCRRCNANSADFNADEFKQVDNFSASRVVECTKCSHTWWEVYTFSHTEDIPSIDTAEGEG